MANNSRNSITISRRAVQEKGGVVVLSLGEYRKLLKSSIPTYYLSGKAAEGLDRLVKEGLRDYRQGKTKKIKSLADLD